MNAIALLLLSVIPYGEPALDRVDLVELNHFYDEQGRLVFDQVIFYDWCNREQRFQVRAWRLVKDKKPLPERDWDRGGWAATWKDGELVRTVLAESFRESWLQYDPELVEREWLPKEQRKELRALLPLPTKQGP